MSARATSSWIVLKFGGTSVSTAANWRNIAAVVRERLHEARQVLVVHSALSGITDALEKLLAAARLGQQEPSLRAIEERHRQLAADLDVDIGVVLLQYFEELRQSAAVIALTGEISARTHARIMAHGELMATQLGAAFLLSQGIEATWWDARQGLKAVPRANMSARAHYLAATCEFSPDPGLQQTLGTQSAVVITQGFIASDTDGDTVLLGRGGSDTSGAYFAAKLAARRLEIWTDVPGLFSANPRSTPTARLLRSLHYDEAQEIASGGAKVLHPRCILPARSGQIPIWVYATQTPRLEGTHISADGGDGAAQVKAVCIKKGITLISMDSPGMWHEVGFLADAFQVFKRHGLSVDQVSTSETNVTVSLDPAANALDPQVLAALTDDLALLCRAQIIGPCAAVSLVGRNIRAILHRLGEAFELFAEQRVYMVSQAANDLNFTFVVDERQGERLVSELHERLIRPVYRDPVLGPTWEQLFAPVLTATVHPSNWWLQRRQQLLELMQSRESAYVYDGAVVTATAQALKSLKSVVNVLYAMKANPHAGVLRLLAAAGMNFECVSRGEIEHLRASVPGLATERILFTPNFAGRPEYAWALAQGIGLTIDNLYVLRAWGEMFRGQRVFVRVDTGTGRGHHAHVRTAGSQAKFGVPIPELDELQQLALHHGTAIVGLHAHTGSGVFDVDNWAANAALFMQLAQRFPDVRTLDLGGGLGVPENPQQAPLNLERLDAVLLAARQANPQLALWLEPGRYLVARAGVLLARVTQLKTKDDACFVGIATGMNSLIRPALYGAWHEIVNLTRVETPATELVNVVGPICESADFLGHDRLLPPTEEGDVLLIANAGAYGHSMSSRYNLREPAEEILL